MPQRPEAPRLKPKDVYASSDIRLARVRLAGRRLLQAHRDGQFPGVSVLEFMPPQPAVFDSLFNSRAWQYIDYFFNSKGLDHQYAEKYRNMEMGREKHNAEFTALGFVNRQAGTLEQQRDTTGTRRGRRIVAQAVGTRIVARAVMGEKAPIKTYWALEIINHDNDPSALSILTTNTKTASMGRVSREPQQQRVLQMAIIDPATIAPRTLEPYAQPHNVSGRTALYQTVETAFALMGIAAATDQLKTYPDVPIVEPDSL